MAASVSGTRSASAIVRLEVRVGSGRPTLYEVGDGGFLIGSVPGCDLRLPGTNLAPVICLISRQATGASLRKLAPVLPITVNGQGTTAAYLKDGDQISLDSVEILVAIEAPAAGVAPVATPGLSAEALEHTRHLDRREKSLSEKEQLLETERVVWNRRRDEADAQYREQSQQLDALAAQLRQREHELSNARAELERRDQSLRNSSETVSRRDQEFASRAEELTRQEAEVVAMRRELSRIRTDLVQKYQHRRDQLMTQQEAIRTAARKVQQRKQEIDQQAALLAQTRQERLLEESEIASRSEQIQRERELVEEQHRLFVSRQQEHQRELARRLEDLQSRERAVVEEKALLEEGQKQHQSDLVRLDRIQAGIEQRQKETQQRALEVDQKVEQLQRDSRDLEEQATQMDEWHDRLTTETEALAEKKKEHEVASAALAQRVSAVEGQQAMLVTLRSRMEKMREEMRRQEQALSDQRVLQEASEADLKTRLEEAEQLRIGLANDKQLFEEERRRFDEHRATMEQAVAQLRLARASLDADQQEVAHRQTELNDTATAQEQQAEALLARGQQLEEAQARLQTDRQALEERASALARAEQTLASLQEQVRKRSGEINERQRKLKEDETRQNESAAERRSQLELAEKEHELAVAEVERMRQELTEQSAQLDVRAVELDSREQAATAEARSLAEAQATLATQRQTLATERVTWEVEKQATQERHRQTQQDIEQARAEAQGLAQELTELELRATAGLERLGRAREQLREHLVEIQNYARQSREDIEAARRHAQAEAESIRQQELDLGTAREEHRIAVAAFRQQMIDWQGKLGEMKQTLRDNSSQLTMRQAAVEEQARQVANTQAKLSAEVVRVESEKRHVAERRGEVERHLGDMRQWYRRKLRELAGVNPPDGEPQQGDIVPMPRGHGAAASSDEGRDPSHAVLTLNDEVAPVDRQLGELLASLGLVDADTLQALWSEARRQRRSLRQLLLAGNYLTLYQMALIEAGTLDALILGPVRVIDRLPSTPREAVYRVFDPRRDGEAVLRHLAESEMEDAVRPDEFRQRFTAAAAVRQPNVAAVLESLTVAGRPAALVEYVQGLPSSDWPGLAAAPGVWYRLLCQAAFGLHAVHTAGQCHGHLEGGSFVLAADGTLKLLGLGEPDWLATGEVEIEESVTGDLLALGRLASEWAALPPSGKGSKSKPLPEDLAQILAHLTSEVPDERFPTALALIDELERVAHKVPASTAAWGRLLEKVREQTPAVGRRSA